MRQDRYHDDPMLRFLELYVLWCIGHVPEDQSGTLEEMTPKLQKVFGRRGTWYEIIEAEMEMPENAREQISRAWRAVPNGVPQEFAEAFVDHLLT